MGVLRQVFDRCGGSFDCGIAGGYSDGYRLFVNRYSASYVLLYRGKYVLIFRICNLRGWRNE